MRPLQPSVTGIAWSWLGTMVGIGIVAHITMAYGVPMMIGSFGASAVLLYAAGDSPLAQPRNLVGGHVLSAAVAVSVYFFLGKSDMTITFAVASAIAVMMATRTLHPPGGATALIGVDTMQGPGFVFVPTLAGAVILLVVALVVNNLSKDRSYPYYWY